MSIERYLNDSVLEEVAKELGPNEWKKLGRLLDVSEVQIDAINFNKNYKELKEHSYQMLLHWREKNGSNATKRRLIEALKKSQRMDIIVKRFSEYSIAMDIPQDEINEAERVIISNHVGKDWRRIGIELGFPETEINIMDYENRHGHSADTFLHMMNTHQKRKGYFPSKQELYQILGKLGRNDLITLTECGTSSLTENSEETADIPISEDIIRQLKNIPMRQKKKYENITLPYMAWFEKIWTVEDVYVDVNLTNQALNLESKSELIKLEEIFDQINGYEVNRILIQAAPGYGKTTLAYKLLHDWAQEKNYIAHKFVFAFLVSLRNYDGEFENVLLDEICVEDLSPKEKLQMISLMQSRILVILDGYDELSENLKHKLHPLIRCDKFPFMTVIVTSRAGHFPIKASNKDNFPDVVWSKKLTIEGITDGTRKQFLQKYLDTDVDRVFDEIPHFVKANDKELLECPLFLMMVATLIEDTTTKEIKSVTELYKSFFNFLLRRYIIRKQSLTKDTIFKKHTFKFSKELDVFQKHANKSTSLNLMFPSLDDSLYQFLMKFGKLSLEMLKKGSVSFTKKDILGISNNDETILNSGFLTRNGKTAENSDDALYEPVHGTFLEFLAAVYLSGFLQKSSESKEFATKINSLIECGLEPSKYSLMYLFLIALINSKASVLFKILTSSPKVCNFDSLRKIFEDIIKTEEINQLFLPFIPVYYIVQSNDNVILPMAIQMQHIQALEFGMNYAINIPNGARIYYLILNLEECNLKGINSFMNKDIHCHHLVCIFPFTHNKYCDEIISIMSSIDADKMTLYVNERNGVNYLSKIHKEIIDLQGSLKNTKIHRLVMRMTDYSEDIISTLKGLLFDGCIEKGLFIDNGIVLSGSNIKRNFDSYICKSIINLLGNVSEFSLSLNANTSRRRNSCQHRIGENLKYLGFWQNSVFSNELTATVVIPLEALSLYNCDQSLSKNHLDILCHCNKLKELHCFDSQLHYLLNHMPRRWRSFEILETLHILKDTKIKNLDFGPEILKLRNLTVLIVEYSILKYDSFLKAIMLSRDHSSLKVLGIKEILHIEILESGNSGLLELLKLFSIKDKRHAASSYSNLFQNSIRNSSSSNLLDEMNPQKTAFHLEELKLDFTDFKHTFTSPKMTIAFECSKETVGSMFIDDILTLLQSSRFDKISILSEDSIIYESFRHAKVIEAFKLNEEVDEESLIVHSIFKSRGNVRRKLVMTLKDNHYK